MAKKGTKIKRTCLYCGKIFGVSPSRIKNGRGKHCSTECRDKAATKKIKRICPVCEKKFEVKPAIIIRGGGKYCSYACAGISKKGEKSPFWKGGKIKRTCLVCEKVFFVIPAVIKKGEGKYCSRSCSHKARKGFPKHHTKPELIFEEICRQNKLPFRYVGDGQLWIGKKKGTQLNPDFIECNGKKIVVEIFGDYWHSQLFNRKIKKQGTLAYRKKHYKRFKWTPIFIWERDLIREDAEAFVLSTLKLYI